MKKSFYLLSILAFILTLAWMTSSDEINTSFDKSFSIVKFNKQVMSFGAAFNVNQAANFNHLNQTVFDYVFIALLALFLIAVVNYQWHKPTKLPPPWHMCLRLIPRDKISGWKTSNIQYKAFLAHQQ